MSKPVVVGSPIAHEPLREHLNGGLVVVRTSNTFSLAAHVSQEPQHAARGDLIDTLKLAGDDDRLGPLVRRVYMVYGRAFVLQIGFEFLKMLLQQPLAMLFE